MPPRVPPASSLARLFRILKSKWVPATDYHGLEAQRGISHYPMRRYNLITPHHSDNGLPSGSRKPLCQGCVDHQRLLFAPALSSCSTSCISSTPCATSPPDDSPVATQPSAGGLPTRSLVLSEAIAWTWIQPHTALLLRHCLFLPPTPAVRQPDLKHPTHLKPKCLLRFSRAQKQTPDPLARIGGLGKELDDDLLSHGETPHYHRRCVVSLLSSGWDQVVPTLYGRQAIQLLPRGLAAAANWVCD